MGAYPLSYCTFGAACTEVELDSLTGEQRILRSDILFDCGRSMNPALDMGQVGAGGAMGSVQDCWQAPERFASPFSYQGKPLQAHNFAVDVTNNWFLLCPSQKHFQVWHRKVQGPATFAKLRSLCTVL